MNNNPGLNYSDIYLASIKYGYDDFIGIKRHQLLSDGPIVQYSNTIDENSSLVILPAKNFNNSAEQPATYDQKLLGEGYDTTSFKVGNLILKPTFEVPILCDLDNVPANYVFDIFDLARKSVYGDAIEHVARISSVNGATIVLDNREKFLCKFLKDSMINNNQPLYIRISNGDTLKSITSLIKVNNISANNATITLNSAVSATGDHLLAVFIFYNTPTYPLASDIPPNRENYEYSNEFYIASSRDGLYYPCLIDSISFKSDTELASIKVNCVAKRFDNQSRLTLQNELSLPTQYPIYSIVKNEQARIRISDLSGKTLFYGILPAIQSGDIKQSNTYLDYKTGVHFGDDINNLANPAPLMIRSIDFNIINNLSAMYTTHTPRFTFDTSENYINDLGRFDNSCPYGYFSTSRKITGGISLFIPEDEWFKKEFLPAVNSSGEGNIEIDTGYLNFSLSNLVFNISPNETSINSEYNKSVNFSFVSTGYDAMFEVGLSKTGGRL
jgi:hypothetical protein